jgi:selenocysteine lyase/cysteine desulfurase
MSRYEWIGTSPEYVGPAALPALAVHHSLGAARKAARLRYLAQHVRTSIARAVPDARFYTIDDPQMSVGLSTFDVPGVDADTLQQRLRERHAILVQSMAGNARAPEIRGVRVSPNVYSAPEEIDRLAEALAREVSGLRS